MSKMKKLLIGTSLSSLAIYTGNCIKNNTLQAVEELGKCYEKIPFFYQAQINFNYNLGSMMMVAGAIGLIITFGYCFLGGKKYKAPRKDEFLY